jgi:hypothetical protein
VTTLRRIGLVIVLAGSLGACACPLASRRGAYSRTPWAKAAGATEPPSFDTSGRPVQDACRASRRPSSAQRQLRAMLGPSKAFMKGRPKAAPAFASNRHDDEADTPLLGVGQPIADRLPGVRAKRIDNRENRRRGNGTDRAHGARRDRRRFLRGMRSALPLGEILLPTENLRHRPGIA